MIEINNLGYDYSRRTQILSELNLNFLPGKIYGLLGKNGAGKSTLIKNMTGMLSPTRGSCEVFGAHPHQREVSFLKNLFFVPEEYYLPNLSIQALVNSYKNFYPQFNEKQFKTYTNIFQIEHHKKTHQLSLGQKKKILIGFALAANTKVLIMDEPTNGLDIPSKIIFRNMINEAFKKDRIIIITSHQVRDLDELIDAIIIMDHGKVLLNKNKSELAQQLRFELTSIPLSDNRNYLYQEKVSSGFATITKNTSNTESYVDIELLFNAVVAHKLQLN